MRWLLLGLPSGLLLCLVIYLSRPEAAPEEHTSVKVSDSKPETGDPITFLEKCLEHYDREVKGYRLVMYKQEKIGGRLNASEEIEVHFKEKPFSVHFQWRKGTRLADCALYVEGENQGKMLARPAGSILRKLLGYAVARDVDGSDARNSGRYTLPEFGLKKGMERTLNAWKKARQRNILHVEYLGIHEVKELNDRPCFKYHAHYDQPLNDGITDLTIYIDKKTRLQIGSVLEGGKGLIATYFFHDIQLNPKFKEDQFKPSVLKP